MKISLLNVVMFSVGGILVYSGIKGYDPRDVIGWGLGGKKPQTMADKNKDAQTPKVPKEGGQSHPGDKFYPPGTEDGGEPTTPASFPA